MVLCIVERIFRHHSVDLQVACKQAVTHVRPRGLRKMELESVLARELPDCTDASLPWHSR